DYLFIPLGGSRGGRWLTYRNLLLTMTLGGLWHGASWTFVAWGVLHGLLLTAHRLLQDFCKTRPRLDRLLRSPPGAALGGLLTLLCGCVGWVFFRATTFGAAAEVLTRLAVPHAGRPAALHDSGLVYTLAAVALCHALAGGGRWQRLAARLPAPALGLG